MADNDRDRGVAQSGRAAVSKTAGRGFESCHPCQHYAFSPSCAFPWLLLHAYGMSELPHPPYSIAKPLPSSEVTTTAGGGAGRGAAVELRMPTGVVAPLGFGASGERPDCGGGERQKSVLSNRGAGAVSSLAARLPDWPSRISDTFLLVTQDASSMAFCLYVLSSADSKEICGNLSFWRHSVTAKAQGCGRAQCAFAQLARPALRRYYGGDRTVTRRMPRWWNWQTRCLEGAVGQPV